MSKPNTLKKYAETAFYSVVYRDVEYTLIVNYQDNPEITEYTFHRIDGKELNVYEKEEILNFIDGAI